MSAEEGGQFSRGTCPFVGDFVCGEGVKLLDTCFAKSPY